MRCSGILCDDRAHDSAGDDRCIDAALRVPLAAFRLAFAAPRKLLNVIASIKTRVCRLLRHAERARGDLSHARSAEAYSADERGDSRSLHHLCRHHVNHILSEGGRHIFALQCDHTDLGWELHSNGIQILLGVTPNF